MIEKSIEANIIAKAEAAFTAAGVTVATAGAWQFAGQYEDDSDARLEVNVSPRSYEIDDAPCAQFDVSFTLRFLRETYADGTGIETAVDALMGLLAAWQADYTTADEALSIDGFSLAGFRLGGGTLETDREDGFITFTETATLRGVI